MNIKEILTSTVEYFKKHQLSNPRLEAEILLSHVLGLERIQLYVNFDKPLEKNELDSYRDLIYKRAKRIPTAYLLEEKEFMSLELYLNNNVLIPRPETEELVERLIDYSMEKGLENPNIVDVGTGSGAIAVSLGHYIVDARILAIDISADALTVARRNIDKFQLNERVKTARGDLLKPLINLGKNNVDIVVSNPPYIDKEGMASLSLEVKKEPVLALSGGNDGLDIYRKLIPQAKKVLKTGGLLALEIGYNQGETIKTLFDSDWQNVRVEKDLSGHDRNVFA
ncbi:MAG: peptide chain release factor N(5)-glutamine methyltransferase, partial [Halanaerobiaceae bacterium]